MAAEWIEAFDTHQLCRITFWDSTNTGIAIGESIQGTYPQHKHLIHYLTVDVPEASLCSEEDLVDVEYECTRREEQVRKERRMSYIHLAR